MHTKKFEPGLFIARYRFSDPAREHAGPGTRVTWAAGCDMGCRGKDGFDAALRAAAGADEVVLAVGESRDMTGGAKSRADIHLPGRQGEPFDALRAQHMHMPR